MPTRPSPFGLNLVNQIEAKWRGCLQGGECCTARMPAGPGGGRYGEGAGRAGGELQQGNKLNIT